MVSTDHPSADELKAFLEGQLADHAQRRLEVHIEECDACCRMLRLIEPDSVCEQLGLRDEVRRDAARQSSLALTTGSRNGDAVLLRGREPTPGGLHVRCPHCHDPMSIEPDAPLNDICCPSCGSTFSLVGTDDGSRDAASISRIDHFEVIGRLGMGAFGAVWKARDTKLDRTVAIKIPRKGQLQGEEAERFLREARAAAGLRHPYIVPVYEVGRDGDMLYIVTELVRGVPLSEALADERMSQREAAVLVAKIADGLHHAHELGVIHRDLKPSNIMLDTAGDPQIMDFGLAKRQVGEATMTREGIPLGTPAYMSPEAVEGHHKLADRRSDIYSVGCVLFQMLTGELPFRGTPEMQMHKRLTQEPPSARSMDARIHRDLETICLKCMERDRDRRYATAAELRDDLRRFIDGKPIQARPISPIRRWYANNPARAKALVTAFLAMAIVTAGSTVAAVKYNSLRLEIEQFVIEGITQFVGEPEVVEFDEGLQPISLSTSANGALAAIGFSNGGCGIYDLAARELIPVDFAKPAGGDHAAVVGVSVKAGNRPGDYSVKWITIDGKVYALSSLHKGQPALLQDVQLRSESGYPIAYAQFSRNGEYLVTRRDPSSHEGEKNRWIQVWRTADWTRLVDAPLRPDVEGCCVTDDGTIVLGSFNNQHSNGYFTFRTTAHDLVETENLAIGAHYAQGLSVSPDGSLLVFGCGRSSVFDLREKTVASDHQRSEVRTSAISSNKHLAAFGYVDGVIEVVDIKSDQILATLNQDARRYAYPALAFSGDSKYLAAMTGSSLTVWSLDSDRTRLLGHGEFGVPTLAYSSNGQWLVSGGHDGRAIVWELQSEARPRVLECGGIVQSARFSPDDKWIATGSRNGDIRCAIWSTDTWQPHVPKEAEDFESVTGVAFTRDGNFFVAAGANVVKVWRVTKTEDGRIDTSLEESREVSDNVLHLNLGLNDVAVWVTRSADWTLNPRIELGFMDLGEGEKTRPEVSVQQLGWNGVHFFPNGDLATVNQQGVIERRLIDGERVTEYGKEKTFTSCVLAVSGDGKLIAGVKPGRVIVWDTASNKRLFELPTESETWSLAWSSNNEELAVGLSTGQIIRWDMPSIQARLEDIGIDLD